MKSLLRSLPCYGPRHWFRRFVWRKIDAQIFDDSIAARSGGAAAKMQCGSWTAAENKQPIPVVSYQCFEGIIPGILALSL